MSTLPSLSETDRRLNVIDKNGNVVTAQGIPACVKVAFTELREKPDFNCAIDTQVMFGETLQVHDKREGWALVQADRDKYVGWLEEKTLSYDFKSPTHTVCVPRTFFYPEPDLKRPHKGMRSLGSGLCVVDEKENRGTQYAILETGEAVIAHHIRPNSQQSSDYVEVAESLLLTPYLWAGTTAFGIDCSGLVKLSMFMCGQNVLRDSDMQAATIGEEIDPGLDYRDVKRGDLIFWRGHVGIVQGKNSQGQQQLLHANGHSMNVASEVLDAAIERIAYLYEKPIGVRRPNSI